MIQKREIIRVIEAMGYKVHSVQIGKHYKVDVGFGPHRVRLIIACTPRTPDNWHDWVRQDIRRLLKKKGAAI